MGLIEILSEYQNALWWAEIEDVGLDYSTIANKLILGDSLICSVFSIPAPKFSRHVIAA